MRALPLCFHSALQKWTQEKWSLLLTTTINTSITQSPAQAGARTLSRLETAAHQTDLWHDHDLPPCLEQEVNDAQRQQTNGHAKFSETSCQGSFCALCAQTDNI